MGYPVHHCSCAQPPAPGKQSLQPVRTFLLSVKELYNPQQCKSPDILGSIQPLDVFKSPNVSESGDCAARQLTHKQLVLPCICAGFDHKSR